MPRGKRSKGLGGQLARMVKKLKQQRQKHADALQKFDDMFASLGINTHLAGEATAHHARRGRPPGRPAGRRGPGRPPGKRGPGRPRKTKAAAATASKNDRSPRRGRFATTASASILSF